VKKTAKFSFNLFVLELLVYAGLITVYYLLVLHFLGPGLQDVYEHKRHLYAGLALGLIVGQGFLLEVLTRVLLIWMKPLTKDR
jgi:NADH:ubiquinone oxidoreductase subunit 6 (subunit J)